MLKVRRGKEMWLEYYFENIIIIILLWPTVKTIFSAAFNNVEISKIVCT